jgi:gas vesicle protein
MSRSNFFEGVFIGAIIGAAAAYFFADEIDDIAAEIKDQAGMKIDENVTESNEDRIAKTLSAIENGFDNISKIVENKSKTVG